MVSFGIQLSSEEHGPRQLLYQAQLAERAGFDKVLITDHFHPWIERQGESPFVWAVIGGIAATTRLEVTTGVTCPIMRIHPVVLAQAAATAQLMLDGRFRFGVGTGEALNEHIIGERWPEPSERLDRLEEAVEIIRALWRGGIVDRQGRYFRVVGAKIYSRADRPPPILMSAFGPKAASTAARIADGYIGVAPQKDVVERYRAEGGHGPLVGTMKVSWDRDEHAARKRALDIWPTSGVKGELNQELPMPADFEKASRDVTEDEIAERIVCGPNPDLYVAAIQRYVEHGFDELFLCQIGNDLGEFVQFFRHDVEPRL